jgi:DNA-binding NtrC family response regulator
MANQNILVVEDEELMRAILRQLLDQAGYTVFTADSADNAIEVFSANDIALTLTDIKMSGRDGLELLDQIKSLDAEALVIIMTAYSSVDTAIAALRKGAYDYVTKPFVNADLLQTVRNAVEHRKLFQENRVLRREVTRQHSFSEIIGTSDALQKVLELVKKVAATSAHVLIQGESGTGKELIARSVHFNSDRSDRPFLAVNCGALSESLLESELFGHKKGSFTGAVTDSKGLFRSASGGTLFLDEIGEMTPSLQVKLLRALQEHEVTPVGSTETIRFDARIIAATNKDLEAKVAEGRFREDLYYRLNVVEITVPPLRERRDDIPILVRHFASRSSRRQGINEPPVTAVALEALKAYDWPGNIRELEHVIERSVILTPERIDTASLPEKLTVAGGNIRGSGSPLTLDEVERKYISEILERVDGDKVQAAHILGIDLSTLYRKLKRYEPEAGQLAESSSMK